MAKPPIGYTDYGLMGSYSIHGAAVAESGTTSTSTTTGATSKFSPLFLCLHGTPLLINITLPVSLFFGHVEHVWASGPVCSGLGDKELVLDAAAGTTSTAVS